METKFHEHARISPFGLNSDGSSEKEEHSCFLKMQFRFSAFRVNKVAHI